MAVFIICVYAICLSYAHFYAHVYVYCLCAFPMFIHVSFVCMCVCCVSLLCLCCCVTLFRCLSMVFVYAVYVCILMRLWVCEVRICLFIRIVYLCFHTLFVGVLLCCVCIYRYHAYWVYLFFIPIRACVCLFCMLLYLCKLCCVLRMDAIYVYCTFLKRSAYPHPYKHIHKLRRSMFLWSRYTLSSIKRAA